MPSELPTTALNPCRLQVDYEGPKIIVALKVDFEGVIKICGPVDDCPVLREDKVNVRDLAGVDQKGLAGLILNSYHVNLLPGGFTEHGLPVPAVK
jgi:hypothetical protein